MNAPPYTTKNALLLLAAFSLLACYPPLHAAPGEAGETITIPSLGSRFKQTDDRINALFQLRNGTMPKLDPKLNPFRSADTPIALEPETATKGEVALAPETDEVILQRGAATLKVNGIVMIGDRALLTINQGTYKVGDVIVVRVHGRTVFLRIKQIKSHSAVLTLNDAHLELRF